MTRRYTQPAPINGPAGLSYPVVPPPAPTQPSSDPLRRHALALAIVAATGGMAFVPHNARAAEVLCPIQESGTAVSFKRPAGTAAGDKAVYRHTPSMPNTQFYDPRGKTEVEVENCVVHMEATAGTGSQYAINYVVTDIYGNGNQQPSGDDAPRDVSFQGIDLKAMTVDGTAPNTINVNAIGSFGEIIGSGGTAPVHITVGSSLADGMKLYDLRASPDMVVRDDVITINAGVNLLNGLYGQAGNDIINLNGGKSESGLYGDNGYSEDFFNDPANRFNDTFNVNGGDWWYLNGDGSDSTRGGADTFNFVGGIVRNDVHGDGGNDTFNFTGSTKIDGSVYGDDGADKVIISASANLDEVNEWIDGGSSTSNGQYDHDLIEFHGQTLIGNGNVVSPIASVDITNFEDFRLLESTRLIMSNQARRYMITTDNVKQNFYIDPTSTLVLEDPDTGVGYAAGYFDDMVNDGTIDLGTSSPRIQIHFENYSGSGRILLSTYLGDDSSDTDLIKINGDVSGQTTLVITPVPGSPGAQTQEGIIVVDANHLKSVPGTSFVMAAPLTTENGLWQYRLAQNATSKDFVLTSSVPTPTPSPTPTSSPTPSPSPSSSPTPSPSPSSSPTPSPSPSSSPTPSPSPTSSPTPSPSPSPTSSPTPSPSPSPTSSPTPSPSPSPTSSPTPSPSPSPTSSPTPSPSPSPTSSPTPSPSPSPSPTSSPTPSPSPSPTSSPTPSPTATVGPPGDHLLHPRTSVYAMGMLTAQGLVMDSLGGVSDRASLMAGGDGEIGHDDALWMRANYSQVDAGRGQFSADQRQFSLRAGKDLRGDSGSRTGVMGVVASGVAGIDDHVRPTIGGFATPLSARVGEIRTTLLGVGGYHTWIFGSGGYADVSGQVGHLWVSNDVAEVDMSDTRGWSAIASAEVGNRFTVGGGGWSLIPQAQLVASHVRMKDIDDGVVRVDGDSLTAYRARVGLRFENPAGQAPRFYGLANVWRNLTDDAGTTLHGGTDTIVVAPQFARNWLEAGFGLTLPTAKAGSFNVDIRTQRGLGEENDRSALGLQASWKLAW